MQLMVIFPYVLSGLYCSEKRMKCTVEAYKMILALIDVVSTQKNKVSAHEMTVKIC